MKMGFNLHRFLNEKGMAATDGTNKENLLELLEGLKPIAITQDLIRVGSYGDGGYLIPDDLNNVTTCFSPGVFNNADFEQDLTERGIHCHMIDPSVDSPPHSNPLFHFEKKRLSSEREPGHIRLQDWVAQKATPGDSNMLLQMDIEGGEYEVILDTPSSVFQKFRCLVIEFHNIDYMRSAPVFSLYKQAFAKLLQDFAVVHLHPNNFVARVGYQGVPLPIVVEMTFFRRDLLKRKLMPVTLPHPLDVDNNPDKPSADMPKAWWERSISINSYLPLIDGVIHLGANSGQERQFYANHGLKVAWFEASPSTYEELKQNITDLPNQEAFQYLLTDEDDQALDFNVSNNDGLGSSIYDLGLHKDVWPNVHYTHQEKLQSARLDTVFEQEGLAIEDYQAMVLDTQGSELLVLKGAGDLLSKIKYLRIEVADYEGYIGNCTVADIEEFLFPLGFKEATRLGFGEHPAGGSYYDIIYARESD